MTKKMVPVLVLALAMAMAPPLTAQVQTEVPPVVAGAKAVTVEHIKIHGEALEGNLEGMRWIATRSCSCRPATPRRSISATRWSMPCTVIQ